MTDAASEENVVLQTTEQENEEDKGKINIDSSLIESATIRDEDAELENLGLRLYDQSTLESGIKLQVDAAMEKMEAKRQKLNTEKRVRTLRNRIGQLSQKCQRLKSSSVTAPRTYEELQRQKRQQTELAELREELAQLRTELGCLETGGASQEAGGGDQSAEALLSGGGESELEAKVRLGEVTPFGTDLSAVTTEHSSSSARLLDSSSAKSLPATSGASHLPSALLSAAKRPTVQSELAKPRSAAGSSQSALVVSRPPADTSQSDDEFIPSDETADESDEAYVPSDDDEVGGVAGGVRTPVKGAKRKLKSAGSKSPGKAAAKRTRRAPDDGDPEAFAARIKDWRRERREQRLTRIEQGIVDDDDDEERCVEFDGGFRCPASLWDRLFKYQQVCVRWLWELHQQRCGGILGDEMGLGKTVQIIAFLAGLSLSNTRWSGDRGLGPVLVMAPATVLHQWVAEFHRWWPPLRVAVLHESGSHAGSKASLVRQMGRNRGVLLTSYSAMTSHKELLVAQDWHYVILDEGHKIRNPDAQITLAVKQVRTPHRIILSGSPLQNNLRELWSLFDFVFPGKLGTLPVFVSQFSVPITQGGYTNASDSQVVTAFRCAKVLRDTIAPYLLRRMKADVQQTLQLPTKNEQVLFCRLTDVQRQLYQDYINSDGLRRILQGSMKVFVGLTALRKLCNHPDLLTGTPADSEDLTEEQDQEEGDLVPAARPHHFGHWRRAGKMVVLSALLEIWRKQEHKVLLFTQSRQMLSILESFVAGCGYTYLRMDGATSVGSRQTLIRRFNTEPDIFCFLLTTRVGGLGVNLTGANRIIIYDPDWNPSTDQQARERAWRIGQDRHVTIYRLLTAGTIEEKIYHRQIFKQFLTNRVLKDPKQQRFFKTNDLHDLFTLTEEAPEGDAGGGGDSGQPAAAAAAAPQTTETAEIFSGSQVSAAALEARRQREKKLRRQRQAEQARQAEKRRRKLLEKARKLNQKLFTAGEPTKNGVKSGQGKKKHKKRGLGDERRTVEVVEEMAGGVAEVEQGKTAVCWNSDDGSVGQSGDVVRVMTNGQTAEDGETAAETDGEQRGGEVPRGNAADDHETPTAAGAEMEEGGRAEDDVREGGGMVERDGTKAEGEERTQDGESAEEGELVDDDDDQTADSSCRVDGHFIPSVASSSSAALASGSSSRVGVKSMTDPAGPPNEQSPDRRPKKRNKEGQSERRSRRGEEDDRRKRVREERERRKKGGEKEERRKRSRRRPDPLLGEVEGLVDSEVYRPPQTDEDANNDRSQDDYVLTRLFKKSGVHSAVRHDVIEGHGTPDGAILEAEATQVAREAVTALRASRREVRSAGIGTPTWTGQSGRAGMPARPRFGQKKNPLLAAKPPLPPPPPPPVKKAAPALPALFAPDMARVSRPSSSSATAPATNLFGGAAALGVGTSSAANGDTAPLTSAQLLTRIRRRVAGEDGAEPTEVAQEHADLLADIRNFVAFQTSTNGRASTQELLAEFKARLPVEQTALFKALLTEICEFERGADKTGWWVLREELR